MAYSNTASCVNEIIITAMDRFVWFILLVVMSHLVTEFTRVTGYARGNRNDIILVNDSYMAPLQVQNLVFYPGQDYGLYDQSNTLNNNNKLQGNAATVTTTSEQGAFFSFRPLIDSIFEIPISTLRAVNNLVARLTGSYQQTPAASGAPQKSTKSGFQASQSEKFLVQKGSLMREESA